MIFNRIIQSVLFSRVLIVIIAVSILSGCHWMVKRQMDTDYGKQSVVQRVSIDADATLYNKARDILDKRCVVCHACYDAPCQLKLSSFEGLDRGATQAKVYDKFRVIESEMTRLFEDAETTQQWREKAFYPVLNERRQSPQSNLDLSVLYQLLDLKNHNPLPKVDRLSSDFDLRLVRSETCPRIETVDDYKIDHPLWGMPYALPAINKQEFSVLEQWLATGAKAPVPVKPSTEIMEQVERWETFFNGKDNKSRLVSRYLYEHLYLAHFYFDAVDKKTFFKLVRSATPPGEPIKIIPTRRPYDNPGLHFYYRLQLVRSTIVTKTHMPYALNDKRYQFWQQLFFDVDYTVEKLPGYQIEISSNPFMVFVDIPMRSRYKFLLDEAQYSIMNFIKGPVCRGQIALDVINDHFWVVFVNPDLPDLDKEEEFIKENQDLLRFPAYWESTGSPLAWIDLASRQEDYVNAKADFINNTIDEGLVIDLRMVWDGNGLNDNAALTIFRHIDSATVVKGFAGEQPKTAWLIDYPLMERIHYLLVAGFDVRGSLVHQFTTRLYMDFLRMEGEANFLALLPRVDRKKVQESWYIDAEDEVSEYFESLLKTFNKDSLINYRTNDTKSELMDMLADLTRAKRYPVQHVKNVILLDQLNRMVGKNISFLPPSAILEVSDKERSYYFNLIHHHAHKNITYIFRENKALIPEKDSLTVIPEIISAYPNAFYKVSISQVPEFIEAIKNLSSEQDYKEFMSNYGVRRTNSAFWESSDRIHLHFKNSAGVEYGLLDYNRLENR